MGLKGKTPCAKALRLTQQLLLESLRRFELAMQVCILHSYLSMKPSPVPIRRLGRPGG